MINHPLNPIVAELRQSVATSRAPRLRGIREFAEQELTIDEGPFAKRRYRASRQPASALFLAEVDSGRWRRHALTSCVQYGKSLVGFGLPCLHTLFELQETCILGAPTLEVCYDKFRKEILPLIKRSRYASLMPAHGRGSKGGETTSIEFGNGVSLKFMGGVGGDEKRSSYTSRTVVITETDKMDTAGEASRETSPIGQIEARTASFGEDARIFLECTVSIDSGAIWSAYTSGTRSRVACPCPHCHNFVSPERGDFVGWETAPNAIAAGELATFCCPSCGEAISESERHAMNAAAVLLHDGQTIDADGVIAGEAKQTDTLGFRANAFNNLFWSTSFIGTEEWEAKFGKGGDADDRERKRKQFAWVEPIEPDAVDEHELDPYALAERVHPKYLKGEVPPRLSITLREDVDGEERQQLVELPVQVLSGGIDLRKRQAHWIVPAWADYGTGHVVDYGIAKVFSDRMGTEAAVLAALRYLRDKIMLPGFVVAGDTARRRPECVVIDCNWLSPVVYRFIRECEATPETAGIFKCFAGRGWNEKRSGRYTLPVKKSRSIRIIGEQYHMVRDPVEQIARGMFDADYWKSQLHTMLATPEGEPGSLSLPQLRDGDHSELTKQWCAEKQERVWDAEKGMEVVIWKATSRVNHFLDSTSLSLIGGHIAGVRRGQAFATSKPNTPGKWFSARGKA